MIIDTLKSDMKAAMKLRDQIRVDSLRGVMAACVNELVAKGQKPTEPVPDALTLSILKRLAKQRKDAAEQYEKGGRSELAQKELLELQIIETYLPRTASRDDIERVARALKSSVDDSPASKGKLVGSIMKELQGNADGALVKEVVDSLF